MLFRSARKLQAGVDETRRTGNLRGKPAIIVHGRADALLPVSHTSRPYTALNKRVEEISERADGKQVLRFADGTEDTTDVVIGCDGIKSRVRQLMLGEDHPAANPVFTHKYAYRGLIPMEKAIEAVGEELASNACMHVRTYYRSPYLGTYQGLRVLRYSNSRPTQSVDWAPG